MRKVKTILAVAVMATSLFAAAGTAWARSDGTSRGTAWTDVDGPVAADDPLGVSWELFFYQY
jgi:hypothetical protein